MSDRFRHLWRRLMGREPAPVPRVAMVAGGVLQAGVIRVTAIERGGQYTMGWKVRSDDPGVAAALFLARFLPSNEHQQSRRAR